MSLHRIVTHIHVQNVDCTVPLTSEGAACTIQCIISIPSFSCWLDYDYGSDLECGKVCQVICYANIHVPMTCIHMYIVAVQICRLLVLRASEWNMYVQVRHLFLLCQNITPPLPTPFYTCVPEHNHHSVSKD